MFRKLTDLYARLRMWATEYEPAVAKTVAAAFFQLLVGLGIAVGDWPGKVDAVLAFVAIVTTLLAGRSIRAGVFSPDTHRDALRREGERLRRQRGER